MGDKESLDIKFRIPLVITTKHLWGVGVFVVVMVTGWVSLMSQIGTAKASAASAHVEIASVSKNVSDVHHEVRIIRCLVRQSNDYQHSKKVPTYRCEP